MIRPGESDMCIIDRASGVAESWDHCVYLVAMHIANELSFRPQQRVFVGAGTTNRNHPQFGT